MSESPNSQAVVVPIDRYRVQPPQEAGQLALFETGPALKIVDRTRRPLTREGIEHRQRMLLFLNRAR